MTFDQDLTGAGLSVGDQVIEITRGYTGTTFSIGEVAKITKTRVKVGFKRGADDVYHQEYTLRDGRSYPRRADYHYSNISPLTPELRERYKTWVRRKKTNSRIYKLLDEIGHIPREIDRMTQDQLDSVVDALEAVNVVVTKAKLQEKQEDR